MPDGATPYAVQIQRGEAHVTMVRNERALELTPSGMGCTTGSECGLRQQCSVSTCDRQGPTDDCPIVFNTCTDVGPIGQLTIGDECTRVDECAAPATCVLDPAYACDRERAADECPRASRRCVARL